MRALRSVIAALGVVGFVSIASAQPVEYVKVCSLFGAGFHYIPGTDMCLNEATGDARVNTEGGVWRTLLPFPEGAWVTNPQQACGSGRLVKLGTFKSTDFSPNPYARKQTQPVPLSLKTNEFISRVIMSGGFYDPRIPSRSGVNGLLGLCLRSVDPSVIEYQPTGSVNPPYGAGQLPIGCVANSRIVNMPAAYSVSATAAYPNIDAYFTTASQTPVSGPYVYGKALVVTTDGYSNGLNQLTYSDAASQTAKPMAGTLTAWVCVDGGGVKDDGRGNDR